MTISGQFRVAVIATMAVTAGVTACAQQPAAVTLDGKAITIKYTPSAMKGRKIFGSSVPYNQVWKIGDAAAPTLHTGADIVFKGVTVPKGDYSLYVLVAADKWQLIINKQTGLKAANYDPKMDVGRVLMTQAKAPAPLETSRLTLTKAAAMAAKIEIAWENTIGTVQFHLDRVAGDSEW
jgi:hypothetical protein